jgi:O-antigen/teichoic acid export membrane protein
MRLRQLGQDYLERTGRRLHVDTVFYSKIIGWVGLNYASGILRGVATTFFLARLLPTEMFGAFRYVIAVYGAASILSFSSYHTGIIRGIAANDTEVAWSGAKRMIHLSLLGTLIIFLAAGERFWRHDSVIGWSLIVSSLAFPLASVSSLYGSILTGKGEISLLSKYNAVSNLVFVLIFSLTLVIGRTNLILISLVFFAGDVLIKGALSLYQLSRLVRRGSAEHHLKLGSHLSFMGLFQTFAHQSDQLIIQHFFGYTSLANYSIAILIPEQINDFAKSFSGILLMRKTNVSEKKSALVAARKQFILLFFLACFVCVGYAVSARYFLQWFFPAYVHTYWSSVIYSLGLLSFPSVIGLAWQQSNHELKRLWVFSLVNGLLQITGSIVFAYFFQAFGLIIAKTTTRLISTLLTYPIENSPRGTSTKAV